MGPMCATKPTLVEFPLVTSVETLVEIVESTSIDKVLGVTKLPTIEEVTRDISLVNEVLGDIEAPRIVTMFIYLIHPQQLH